MVDRKEVIEYISTHINNTVPGLLATLNMMTKIKGHNQGIIELFLTNPQSFIEIISEYYSGDETLMFIVGELFVKPLVQKIMPNVDEKRLVELYFKSPKDFITLISGSISV